MLVPILHLEIVSLAVVLLVNEVKQPEIVEIV